MVNGLLRPAWMGPSKSGACGRYRRRPSRRQESPPREVHRGGKPLAKNVELTDNRPVTENPSGRCVSAATQIAHRPGLAPVLGLRAGSDGLSMITQTGLAEHRGVYTTRSPNS